MSWKRSLMETLVWFASRTSRSVSLPPDSVQSIFVLRNNDIGDLLVITPLFSALRSLFPYSRVVAGVGDWNVGVLSQNPNVDLVVPINAPWHNKAIPRQTPLRALRYIYASNEARLLRARKCDVGIDVLGSPFGSLLLMRAGIPCRLGVKGYAGGHTGVQQYLEFNPDEHVGRFALRFAELLGATDLPQNRPQIFLTPDESQFGEKLWGDIPAAAKNRRIVVGPGGGFASKCWPVQSYAVLMKMISESFATPVAVVGGEHDRSASQQIARGNKQVHDFTGRLSLRQTFSLVSKADLVICNSSMLMHAAAAFSKPTIVLLGDHFPSAQQHARQWGHGDNCVVLGKDENRPNLFAPEEVFPIVCQIFAPQPDRAPIA